MDTVRTEVLKSGRGVKRGGQSDVIVRRSQHSTEHGEKGATSQEMRAASRSWEKETDCHSDPYYNSNLQNSKE